MLRSILFLIIACFVAVGPAAADQKCAMVGGVQICTTATMLEDTSLNPLGITGNPLRISCPDGTTTCFAGSGGSSGSTQTVSDTQSAPFGGAVAMAIGTSYAAQRSIGANCTVAGAITVTFTDGSSLTVPVYVGWQTFPFAVTAITAATSTCNYYNLK